MSILPFRRIRTDNSDIQKLQDSTDETFRSFQKKEILEGRLLEDVAIVSGTAKIVQHKMGRALRGWIIAGKDADARVWETPSTTPRSSLILNASANVTVNIWVF